MGDAVGLLTVASRASSRCRAAGDVEVTWPVRASTAKTPNAPLCLIYIEQQNRTTSHELSAQHPTTTPVYIGIGDRSAMATGHRSIPDRNAERMEAARAYRRLHTGMAQAVADSLTLAHRCAHRYLVKGASQWDSKDRMQRRTPTRRTSGPGRGGWRWGRLSLSKPCSTKTT